MQFEFDSDSFILNAYCKNELHDMKNDTQYGLWIYCNKTIQHDC
jgi:hypothetical protein